MEMNDRALHMVAGLVCLLLACFMADHVMASENPPGTTNAHLSVRESLIPMFAMGDFSGPYVETEFPLWRLNPKVREYARFYLEQDNARQMQIYGAIYVLGFVGDEDDALFIGQYVDKNLLGSPDTFEDRIGYLRNIASCAGAFAGMMIERDIKGADAFMKKYARVAAWTVPGEEETPESLSNARDLYSYFLMNSYQYSKSAYIYSLLQEKAPGLKPYLHELFLDSLAKIKVAKYTELMSPRSVPPAKLDEMIAKSLERYGEWIDMLMKKQTYAQWREAHEKEKAAAKAEKRPAGSVESVDMSETVEGKYVKTVARAATEAFEQVSKAAVDRNAANAPLSKEVLQGIQKAGLNDYSDFHVTVDVHAAIGDFIKATERSEGDRETDATKPTVLKEKRNAVVTFRIEDTADIVKRYVPEAGLNASVSPTTGDVMIQMTRGDDTWRWGVGADFTVQAMADMMEAEYLIESVRAAMSAYAQISGAIINGNYDLMIIPVIDNGELIPLQKRTKDKDQMAKALDVEKKVLQELMNAKLSTYDDHRVKVRLEATLSRGKTGAQDDTAPVAVQGYETADVTFMIRNGAEAYRRHAPERSGYDSLDDAGNLRVWMKRINGTWYWNPFGW